MSVSVEYLALYKRRDTFCSSVEAFTRLLQVDSDVVVNGAEVSFRNLASYRYELTCGDVSGKEQRYFHIRFTANVQNEATVEGLQVFSAFLRTVRSVISMSGGETETIRDEVSSYFAKSAYPIVHEIENLMRRLIANFMLVNVGLDWAAEVLPGAVKEAVRKTKGTNEDSSLDDFVSKDYLNILNNLDFIHLGNILFDSYSKFSAAELHQKLAAGKTLEDFESLRGYVPESNWKRYFSALLDCDDGYIQARWKKLYLLRCKVAHNSTVTERDFLEIVKLSDEIRPILVAAISKLPQVAVSPSDTAMVAASAAKNTNAAVGEFISQWQELDSVISRRVKAEDFPSHVSIAYELSRRHLLVEWAVDAFVHLEKFRNSLIHGRVTDEMISVISREMEMIKVIKREIETASCVIALAAMEHERRRAHLHSRIANDYRVIFASPQFSATAGRVKYFFDESGLVIRDITILDADMRVSFDYLANEYDKLVPNMIMSTITGSAIAVINHDGDLEIRDLTAVLRS